MCICVYPQSDELDVGMYLMMDQYTETVHTAGNEPKDSN